MINNTLLDEISSRFSQLAASGPAADLEKNARAFLGGVFSRLDLVSREEFEVQRALLAAAEEKLTRLEARLGELEKPKGA